MPSVIVCKQISFSGTFLSADCITLSRECLCLIAEPSTFYSKYYVYVLLKDSSFFDCWFCCLLEVFSSLTDIFYNWCVDVFDVHFYYYYYSFFVIFDLTGLFVDFNTSEISQFLLVFFWVIQLSSPSSSSSSSLLRKWFSWALRECLFACLLLQLLFYKALIWLCDFCWCVSCRRCFHLPWYFYVYVTHVVWSFTVLVVNTFMQSTQVKWSQWQNAACESTLGFFTTSWHRPHVKETIAILEKNYVLYTNSVYNLQM